MSMDELRDELWRRLYFGDKWKQWQPGWRRANRQRLARANEKLTSLRQRNFWFSWTGPEKRRPYERHDSSWQSAARPTGTMASASDAGCSSTMAISLTSCPCQTSRRSIWDMSAPRA